MLAVYILNIFVILRLVSKVILCTIKANSCIWAGASMTFDPLLVAAEMTRCDKVGELMDERQNKDRREQNKVRYYFCRK